MRYLKIVFAGLVFSAFCYAAEYFEGTGYGNTPQQAKSAAIKDLSTNLQVSVKYSAQDVTTRQNNELQTSGYTNVSLESQIKDLPGLEVVKETKKKDQYIVQVRVDKALLQSQILNRVQSNQAILNSVLQSCNTIGFSNQDKFKKAFRDYQKDLSLYNIVSKNTSYGSMDLARYNEAANALPSYKVNIKFDNELSSNDDAKRIIYTELGKFIKIDDDSKNIVEILVSGNDSLVLYFDFYDCNGKLDSNVKFDATRNRLGPIVYKGLEASLESAR